MTPQPHNWYTCFPPPPPKKKPPVFNNVLGGSSVGHCVMVVPDTILHTAADVTQLAGIGEARSHPV